MAINRSVGQQAVSVAEHNSHGWRAKVRAPFPSKRALESAGPHAGRDLADAVHLFAAFTVIIQACSKLPFSAAPRPAQDWLARASEAFERERLYLVRLTSAVGPLPSTPGRGGNRSEPRRGPPCARNAGDVGAAGQRTWRRDRAGWRLVADPPAARPRRRARRNRAAGALASRRSFGGRGGRHGADNAGKRARSGIWR